MNEAETCRTMLRPYLETAKWDQPPHSISEQDVFTDGRIVFGSKTKRQPRKRSDFLLRLQRDFPLAVAEAKSVCDSADRKKDPRWRR